MKTSLQKSKFLLFSTETQEVFVDVYFRDENIWLSQKLMSALYSCSIDNIALHLKNIYKEGELIEESTTEEYSLVQKEGKRKVKFYRFFQKDYICPKKYYNG